MRSPIRTIGVCLAVFLAAAGCSSDTESATTSTPASVSLSMRPVLGVFPESPAVTDPEGDHPPGLDSDTGLTVKLHADEEAYLPSPYSFEVYRVGPAFLTEADIKGAEARFTGAQAGGGWVVVPMFTEVGGELFRDATGALTQYPAGDPRRQLAIVINGEVISAPMLATNVGPEGLDPEQVVITVAGQEEAEELAAALGRPP